MKSFITVLITTMFYVFYPVFNDARENAVLYGEWKNADQQSAVRTIKFFPNHLVNVAVGNEVEAGTYIVLKSIHTTDIELSGQISPSDSQQLLFFNTKNSFASEIQFNARFSNDGAMYLKLNKDGDLKTMVLNKTRALLPGTILIN